MDSAHHKSSPVSAGRWEEARLRESGGWEWGVKDEGIQPLPFSLSLASHPQAWLPARFETVFLVEGLLIEPAFFAQN